MLSKGVIFKQDRLNTYSFFPLKSPLKKRAMDSKGINTTGRNDLTVPLFAVCTASTITSAGSSGANNRAAGTM